MIGYFGEVFYVIALIQGYMFTNGGVLLFFVSICLIHRAFSKMFLHSLKELNGMDNNRSCRELICKLIRFRSRIKESVICVIMNFCRTIFTRNIFSLFILVGFFIPPIYTVF